MITLTGHQVKTILEFVAPDGDTEQLESDVTIEWKNAGPILDGDPIYPAGYYAWLTDYPDEGSILL